MKKIIIFLLCLIMLFMVGCSSSVTCAFCGNETKKSHSSVIDGEKIYICDDCYKQLNGEE